MSITDSLSTLPADLSTGCRLLWLIHQSNPGKSQVELAALTGATDRSIRNWRNELKTRGLDTPEGLQNTVPVSTAESVSGGYWRAKRDIRVGRLKFSEGQRIDGVSDKRLKDLPLLVEWIPEQKESPTTQPE